MRESPSAALCWVRASYCRISTKCPRGLSVCLPKCDKCHAKRDLGVASDPVFCKLLLATARRPMSRDTLRVCVHHPMGSITVNCCLSSYQLSFRGERKLQRIATKGRTYGSPLDSNSLVTLAVPRYGRGTATACHVSATSGCPPLRRSALGLMPRWLTGGKLVE